MQRAGSFWNRFSNGFLDALYPRKCALCGLFSEDPICQVCRFQFYPSGREIEPLGRESPLDFRIVLYSYSGRAGQAVQRLKYSRVTSLIAPLSELLTETVDRLGLLEDSYAVPVPIHWSRRCIRGFNQSEALCERLPRERILHGAIKRVRSTRPQVGLTRDERLKNLAGAFRANPAVAGKDLLLVDDVLTSGQTSRECAMELKRKGAATVGILAFCGNSAD